MNILFVRDNPREYIAKIYWSLQKGLQEVSCLCTFGEKQQYYDKRIKSYPEIIRYCGFEPDLIISDYQYHLGSFRYQGMEKIDCLKAFILGDYWSLKSERQLNRDMESVGMSYIFSLFRESLKKISSRTAKMVWVPPSVDPEIFRDWGLEKEYTVGFLGSGCHRRRSSYPERYRMTESLSSEFGDRFYTSGHPGWGYHKMSHPLIGSGFSRAINRCQMFVSTSGTIGHCNPKYYEIAASGSLLLCQSAADMDHSGFIDGETCAVCTEGDIIEKVRFYESHPYVSEGIIRRAGKLIESSHTSTVRAAELLREIAY